MLDESESVKTVLQVLGAIEHTETCENGERARLQVFYQHSDDVHLFQFRCSRKRCHGESLLVSTQPSVIIRVSNILNTQNPSSRDVCEEFGCFVRISRLWIKGKFTSVPVQPKSIQGGNKPLDINDLANLQIAIGDLHQPVPVDYKKVEVGSTSQGVVQLVNWIIEAAVNSRSRFWDAYADAYLAQHGEGPPELPMPVLVVNDEIIRVTKAAPEIAGMKTMRLGIYEVYDTDGLKPMPSWIDRIPGFVCYCELQ